MSDIIKAQQGLARKATRQPNHRFNDLYFLLCKEEWITYALHKVLSNSGAKTPGIDGLTRAKFYDPNKTEAQNAKCAKAFVQRLQAELRAGTFKPSPVRRVEIPKPGNKAKKRPLGIRTIQDRVVATLLKLLLEPIWESDFAWFSNGFRPTRCTMDCIQSFYSLANTQLKYYWVIEGDIRNCFGAIPHHKLISQVARRIADPRILRLINRFLKSGIMERNKFVSSTEGVSQGDPLSPLLANIYLHSFDSWFSEQYLGPDCKTDYRNYHNWVRRRAKGKALAAAQIFRYADDWVVLVRGTKVQAASIKENIKQFLRNELKLELSEEKTHLTHIKDGFDFLGFHIFRNNKPKNRRRTGVFVVPTKPSFKRVRQKIREMTNRASLVDDYLAKLIALNAVIRGWANYYRAVNPMATFKKLDRFVWHRLARWLQAKHTTGTHKVRKSYQAYQPGVKGGGWEFGTMDEATGKWVWRYKAVETKLSYYRPKSKKYWPNPYLVDRLPKTEQFELPNLKAMWTGRKPAPEYEPIRRQVLGRAGGQCERCGNTTALQVHHKHRVGRREGKNKLKTADNRPEMLEALCKKCHNQEHRAEQIQQGKQMVATRTRQVIAKVSEPKLTG